MLQRRRSTRSRRLVAGLMAFLCLVGKSPASPAPAADPGAAANRPAGEIDFERIYREALPSVFVVETASWAGPGILSDGSGLILAPFLDLSPGGYAAVLVAPGRKVGAEVLKVPGSSCTILRVNPEAVAGLAAPPMVGTGNEEGLPAAGDRLLAIFWSKEGGFFRRTVTLEKVTRGEYATDLTLPASSGPGAARTACSQNARLQCAAGIFLDARGRLVGMEMMQKSGRHPQMRIVRLRGTQEVLDRARAEAAKGAPPAPTTLPVAPEIPFPEEALKRLSRDLDPALYRMQAGPYVVQFQTPPVARAEILRRESAGGSASGEVCGEPKGTENRWRPGYADETPVVTVLVVPEIRRNGGTYVGVTAYWIFIPVIFVVSLFTGTNIFAGPPPHVSSRFDPAIREIELLRGGRKMEPIHPGRTCGTASTLEIDFCPPGGPDKQTRRVKGCYLAYSYPAEDFAPGEPLELRIYPENGNGAPTILPVEEQLRARIWSDFEPYREKAQGR